MPTKLSKGIYLLPNLFTTGTLFAGFYGVVSALSGAYENAAAAIFIAMLMDGLDGRIARMTNTQSEFGAEYDSLADMASFAFAPALIIYTYNLEMLGKLGWLVAFIYTASGALRLARFNTQASSLDKRYFQGLPSPAAAALICGMVWCFNEYTLPLTLQVTISMLITLFAGVAMVSNLRYRSFKEMRLKNKVPFVVILIAMLIIVFIALKPPLVLFSIFFLYALSGPIETVFQLKKNAV